MTDHAQPALFDDPHARRSDPISSHVAVAAIAADDRLVDHIQHAARRLHPSMFDDTDLHGLVEEQSGRRQQRNVIARSRGLMENAGLFVRVGLRDRGDRTTMHYRLPHPGEEVGPGTMPDLRPQYRLLESVLWCKVHKDIAWSGGTCHHGATLPASDCQLQDLYTYE